MSLFAIHIAKRYLFSKKTNNVINIISLISGIGVAIGTAALVCVLSVFNGFGGLVTSMFSSLDPDLRIEIVNGKTIQSNLPELQTIRTMDGVSTYCEVYEDLALLKFKDKQVSAVVRGVDDNYNKLTSIDSIMWDGKAVFHDGDINYAVMGFSIANTLGATANSLKPLYIYAPRKSVSDAQALSNPMQAFRKEAFVMGGIYTVEQPEYDEQLIISKEKAQELFEAQGLITNVELKITNPTRIPEIKDKIKHLLGNGFRVLDQHEQQSEFFKMMSIEKWMSYLLLTFILLIATFNVIGSLSMLVIDKQKDIAILRSMGAEYRIIRRIFLFEGWSISILGTAVGVVLGTVLCLLQQHFGLIHLGGGGSYLVNAYPVQFQIMDVVLISITVISIGFFAAYYPVRYIFKNYIV